MIKGKSLGFFDKKNESSGATKILLGLLLLNTVANVFMFKSVIKVSENMNVIVSVPPSLDVGKYYIGSNTASKNVYQVWSRVWFNEIATFSYKNIRKKIEFIEPFLDRDTLFESKAELDEMVLSVEKNFITQKFEIADYSTKRLDKKYVEITARGTLYRKIGLKQDELNGIPYKYTIIAYSKHGSVYIKNLSSFVDKTNVSTTKKILKSNKYLNFDKFIADVEQEAKENHEKTLKQVGGL